MRGSRLAASSRNKALVAAALALGACGGKKKPPAGTRAGSILGSLLTAADAEKTPWRCAAQDTPALPDEDLGPHWKTHDHSLVATSSGDEIVIGFFADAAGDAPRTIASLGRLRAQLDAAKPDLVITLGGMGRDPAQIAATIGTVADRAGWPVVALPGDLESAAAQTAAVDKLRKRGDLVVDGRLVRWIETGGATIGTIPGASAAERLVAAGDGCGWTADDVAKLVAQLTKQPGLRIVASAEAPRTMRAGEPTGELALVPPEAVDIVVHGPTAPTASAATDGGRDGAKVSLTPGTADATPRLPDAHSASAGVLAIRGTDWTWRPLVDESH